MPCWVSYHVITVTVTTCDVINSYIVLFFTQAALTRIELGTLSVHLRQPDRFSLLVRNQGPTKETMVNRRQRVNIFLETCPDYAVTGVL